MRLMLTLASDPSALVAFFQLVFIGAAVFVGLISMAGVIAIKGKKNSTLAVSAAAFAFGATVAVATYFVLWFGLGVLTSH